MQTSPVKKKSEVLLSTEQRYLSDYSKLTGLFLKFFSPSCGRFQKALFG